MWAPKWDEMKALFSEAHGIVNEYRPHQARETLIFMMEEQVERCRRETGEVREVCGKVRGVIEGVERGEGVQGWNCVGVKEVEKLGIGERERERKKRLVEEKRMWEVIEDEVGSFD